MSIFGCFAVYSNVLLYIQTKLRGETDKSVV